MQGDGGQLHLQQGRVLHNQRIDTCAVQLPHQLFDFGQLFVPQNGVERHIDACPEQVGVAAQLGYVVHTVACCRPCAEVRATYIHGVGSMAYGFDAAVQVACGRKQFDGLLRECLHVVRGDKGEEDGQR